VIDHYPNAMLNQRDYNALDDDRRYDLIEVMVGGQPRRWVDLANHWISKINHAPPHLCNVVFGSEALIQKTAITGGWLAGDYGCPYWVWKVTGIDIEVWIRMGVPLLLEAFDIMHRTVIDYTSLFSYRELKSGNGLAVRYWLGYLVPSVGAMLQRQKVIE
jgi:hypothetical protein